MDRATAAQMILDEMQRPIAERWKDYDDWKWEVYSEALDQLDTDWAREQIGNILEQLADGRDADDFIGEFEGDIYNADLTQWLADSLHHAGYTDDAMQEYGPETIYGALVLGQYHAYSDLAITLEYALDRVIDEWEDDEE